MVVWQFIGATVIAICAIQYQRYHQKKKKVPEGKVTYAIGDLHGDADCARYWVEHMGLVDKDASKWLKPEASLVFMGDYVDRGPQSMGTIEYVKKLTDSFPDKVTALMGNHEMELLKDRDPTKKIKYLQMPYATVHPEEYLQYLKRPQDDKDKFVIDLLMNVSLEIYGNGWHNHVLTTGNKEAANEVGRHAMTELLDDSMRPLVAKRLSEYQSTYLSTYASNATLGKWLESLPVAHIENDVFFCHGGVNQAVVKAVRDLGGIDKLNEQVQANAGETELSQWLASSTPGRAVYDMLTYRGNHKTGACSELPGLLEALEVKALAVGHTPGENVRSSCDGSFWALDSLLGRWIRTSGNYYCRIGGGSSQNGKFACDSLVDSCMGQVARISNGSVDVLS